MTAPRLKQSAQKNEGIEKRSMPRLDIRRSDGLTCMITCGEECLFSGRPYDLSLNSLAVLVPRESLVHFSGKRKFQIKLDLPDFGSYQFKAAFVSAREMPSGEIKIAFTLESAHTEIVEVASINQGAFVFPPIYSINAFLYKPSFFFEKTFVKVIEIEPNGISFGIYDLETLVFPGMELELFLFDAALQFPPLKVRALTSVKNGDHLLIRAEILHFPKAVAKRLSQVLIFDFQMSIEAVKKLGLPVPKISDGLRFRFIRAYDEYEEVLKLRFKAYQLAGKVPDGKTHLDMAAPLDHISRILVAYHGQKIVSSIAISFPTSNDMILDTERAFPNGYPKKVPPKVE